ncbi:MAG: DNA/RNA nuclease SfsA [Thermoplasmatales archaeon]|nr:DNA/RNA nuclease SfsA [Thermoplasmatales archaeon]
MRYDKTRRAVFLRRPNRFIAVVSLDGREETCHVKNTGRCRELLVEGATVILSEAAPGNRKTRFDLVAVYKEGRLINMDSQIVNGVLAEALPSLGLFDDIALLKSEAAYGRSRFDFYIEHRTGRAYIEVKGVTLERDGIVFFPDAPTERGVRHVRELADCIVEGYEAYLIFVIQMSGVRYLSAEGSLHPDFWSAVEEAEAAGVKVLAYDCSVEEDSITLRRPVSILPR